VILNANIFGLNEKAQSQSTMTQILAVNKCVHW